MKDARSFGTATDCVAPAKIVMSLQAYTVAVGAALGIVNLVAAARRSHFENFAKTAHVEPRFKDFRAMFRSDGTRERAIIRSRGYSWLATSCSVGLILFAAANTLQHSFAADLAAIIALGGAISGLNVSWFLFDRMSLAIEAFNVYFSGFGRSFVSFEVALESFRFVDAKSYAIASTRLRARQEAAVLKQERATHTYLAGLKRMLA